ncbi:MAG: aldose 1-epimerase [Ferruginibacter sp.]
MFSISRISENGFDKIILANEITGCRAEILPGCGAILNAFIIKKIDNEINIIEGYETAEDFDKNFEAKGFRSAKLSPFVCRLKGGNYLFGKTNYQVSSFYLGKHAIHGLIYKAAFRVSKFKKSKKSAFAELEYKYREAGKGFPFAYNCIIRYELKTGNRLVITTCIVNKGKSAMPITDGWHPYFSFGKKIDDIEMRLRVKKMLEFDEELIPTGKLLPNRKFKDFTPIGAAVFDNCFSINPQYKTVLQLRDRTALLQLNIKPASAYPYLQLYTPDHRGSIAVENLSAAPDAFNNRMGLLVLKKGEKKIFRTEYDVKKIKP